MQLELWKSNWTL